ncbi:hypothetical protein J7426_24755, partial [Tropicibacter sp. R16_0]|nr:hypothetical protein [Tropicibacter sp. R16_0]
MSITLEAASASLDARVAKWTRPAVVKPHVEVPQPKPLLAPNLPSPVSTSAPNQPITRRAPVAIAALAPGAPPQPDTVPPTPKP